MDVFICTFAFLDLCMQESINGLLNSIIKEEKYTCEKFQVKKLNKAIKISEISWTHSYSPITDDDLCQVPK